MYNVLIVEDDPMVALINQKYIELIEGFKAIGNVTTKEKVIKYLMNKKIDLIVLDIYLPEENGLEILKSIRDKGYLTDVIMITAANSAEEVKKAFAYGSVDYLIKPFEFDRFNEAISKFLSKQKLLCENQGLIQNDIDLLSNTEEKADIPKGLQKNTLDNIINVLNSGKPKVWTIREISAEIGVSNVTIKKYMDYLEKIKRVKSDSYYGNVGRPEYKYVFIK